MTVYDSSSREFSVGELIRIAYIDARIISIYTTLSTAQVEFGRDKLDLLLGQLPVRAPTVRQSRVDSVTLVVGTQTYTLASDVVGAPGPTFFLEATANTTTPLRRKELDMVGSVGWLQRAQGVEPNEPSFVWAELGKAPAVLHVWGATCLGTLQIRVTRLLMNAGPGENTLDIERTWVAYLQKKLTAELCSQRSITEARVFHADADRLLDEANRSDGDATEGKITMSQPNRWSAWR